MATPQYPAPPQPPQPPLPPTGKKTSPLVWILGGCLGIIIIGSVMFAVGTYLVAKKVKEVAGGNPAGIVRMIAAMNPDLEVVSTDEATGKVTIRNRKDGKVVTMNFEDIKNGKLTIQGDGEEAVTFQAGKDGQGSLDIKRSDGTTAHLGAGTGKAPAWVPAYPGSSPQGTYSAQGSDQEVTGSYTFKTADGMDKVAKYYQDALKSGGFTIDAMSAGGTGAVVTGKTGNDKRTVSVNITPDGGETAVAVIYNEKR